MSNFNKFLNSGEVVKQIARTNKASYRIYVTIALLLLSFFMIFPMWRAGRQGFWLWVVLVFFLVFVLIRQILNKESLYLLTNRRLIYLKIVTKDQYKPAGSIRISDIKEVKISGKNICIVASGRKFYLMNLEEPAKLYEKIQVLE